MVARLTCAQGHQWDLDPVGQNAQANLCPECGSAPALPSAAGEKATSHREDLAKPINPMPGKVAEAITLAKPQSRPEQEMLERIIVKGYEILGEIGRGGMGVVYRARQVSLKRVVALKMILGGQHAGPEDLARFRSEAEAVARLQHPHIVQIHEVGEENGCPYFSLEFVEGGTLAQKLAGRPLPERQAAQLAQALARAMHTAHQRGIIHRDLKPANVLLTTDGQPKITDFGLAKYVEEWQSESVKAQPGTEPAVLARSAVSTLSRSQPRTQTGVVLGTPSYMAPEQASSKINEIGPATDVYALGAILYEMLTGRPPFRAETPLDTVMQVVSDEPEPPRRLQPHVPRDLETICLKCLEKEPRKRYASASDLADDLDRHLQGEPILARPLGLAGRLLRWANRQPAFATTLIALATFYLNHLLCLFVFQVDGEGGYFHWFVTGLMICWAVGAGLFQRLSRRPSWEEPATFGWATMDVLLFTLLLLNGHGPKSSLLVGYLLLVGGAALRFHTKLVWFVTGICMASYLGLVIYARAFQTRGMVEPYVAFIFLLYLGIMGLIFHLILRRVRTPYAAGVNPGLTLRETGKTSSENRPTITRL